MRVFYTYDDVLRLNAMLSSLPSEVSEELRGWNWSKYPLLAPSRTERETKMNLYNCLR
jgi:CRISPR/Cas system-associated exonuclease Cas4 (RecB family)